MKTTHKLPITISLPQGFTIGGVTTWALAMARRFSIEGRSVRLIVHPPLAGHVTFDPIPSLDGADVDIIDAPALLHGEDVADCIECYRACLPTILLPNLCHASYAIAAELSTTSADDLRVVSWVHGDNPVDYAYLEHFESIVHRYVAVSRQCQTEMRMRLPHRVDDIDHIPYGVEIPSQESRSFDDRRPFRIVYAGRMEQGVKRVIDVLSIARKLVESGLRIEMRLVGDGPHTPMIDARIKAMSNHFTQHGSRLWREAPCPPSKMIDVWRWADVSILASRLEGFSVAMLEAMAAGCIPVVSRVASGVSDIIHDDHNGMSFPIADVDAAARCIRSIAEAPESWQQMSAQAHQSARLEVGMDRYVDRIRHVLSIVESSECRAWPTSHSMNLQPVAEQTNGLPVETRAEEYESVIDFVMSRPDASSVLIYGLGVNGLTLVEQLRADPYLGNRDLAGIDDFAHDAVFETMDLPRSPLRTGEPWSRDRIAIVTPNDPTPLVNRLLESGAEPGVDFICLKAIAADTSASAKETMPC